MSSTSQHSIVRSRLMVIGPLAAAAALILAACGSSSKTSTSATTTPPASSASPTTGSSGSAAGVTISTASVGNFGTILVDQSGKPLYSLSSEKGSKVTCVSSNGCTGVWPPVTLPSGTASATAGSGVQSSMLGTAQSSEGKTYVTYGGYPLYTYTGDTSSGQATGQGQATYGGTWYVMSPSGTPITGASSTSGGPSTTKAGGGWA